MQKVFFIGLVWPEPTSSAAGWRLVQLVDLFIKNSFEVHFGSSAQKTEHSFMFDNLKVTEHQLLLNDSSFEDLMKKIQPNVVVFDRFMTEEQFGWRLREAVPNALTILDTEDLHFVRKAREVAFKSKTEVDFYTAEAQRELASILRSDLSLIISKWEKKFLENTFRISKKQLLYLPFLQRLLTENNVCRWKTFGQRKNFMFIGNGMHEPNYQTILSLKKDIWPFIKEKLPEAELHIYGAYFKEKILQLHQPKQGFYIKGRAEDVQQTMNNYRVLLAPIPFGAGIKGKFVDAMQNGLPSVTFASGSESMGEAYNWPGFVAQTTFQIIDNSIQLYNNESLWLEKQNKILPLYNQAYNFEKHEKRFLKRLKKAQMNLALHRNNHFIGQILQNNQWNSLKYFSKWIEAKNAIK